MQSPDTRLQLGLRLDPLSSRAGLGGQILTEKEQVEGRTIKGWSQAAELGKEVWRDLPRDAFNPPLVLGKQEPDGGEGARGQLSQWPGFRRPQ